jgi:hypothetical protein
MRAVMPLLLQRSCVVLLPPNMVFDTRNHGPLGLCMVANSNVVNGLLSTVIRTKGLPVVGRSQTSSNHWQSPVGLAHLALVLFEQLPTLRSSFFVARVVI